MIDRMDDEKSESSIVKRIKQLDNFQKELKRIKTKQVIVIIAISALAIFLAYTNMTSWQKRAEILTISTGYEIYNAKGEKIKTSVSWKIENGDLFHIHVSASPEVTPKRLEDIRDVIFSNDTVTINGQTYYKGWEGALKSITTEEKYVIPIHFHTIISSAGGGNVMIKLTNMENTDGYEGYTKSIVDKSNHQILKSEITIYQVDNMDDNRFKAVLRHELGHVWGISHSDDPNDLMNEVVDTDHAYISHCDIDTVKALYNGQEKNIVVCP